MCIFVLDLGIYVWCTQEAQLSILRPSKLKHVRNPSNLTSIKIRLHDVAHYWCPSISPHLYIYLLRLISVLTVHRDTSQSVRSQDTPSPVLGPWQSKRLKPTCSCPLSPRIRLILAMSFRHWLLPDKSNPLLVHALSRIHICTRTKPNERHQARD